MAQTAAPGPFENNGITPSGLGVGRVARVEATRQALDFLEENDLGLGIDWDALSPYQREKLVDALTTVFSKAERAAAKAATAEVVRYEERAFEFSCPKCGAAQDSKCRDMRKMYDLVPVKHPHQERLDAMALAAGS